MPPPPARTGQNGSHSNRRDFLRQAGGGVGMLALLDLLAREGVARDPNSPIPNPLAARPPHFPATAKAVIHLFMFGGPSQVDLFDPKPELQRRDGQAMPLPEGDRLELFFGNPGPLLASPFRFERHGASGQWVSELMPELAGVVDDVAFLRSMHADSNNHAPALFQMNTGQIRPGHPSLGSWVTYGLGSENENLPAFVVMCDSRGGPIGGAPNWGSGYMPASYQGLPFRSTGEPILNLAPPPGVSLETQRSKLDLLDIVNRDYVERHPDEPELLARMATYELAFRMQTEAPQAIDLAGESAATRRLYGLDDPRTESFGRRLLVARRLVERGVRFVQVYAGSGDFDENWDAHHNLEKNHRLHCSRTDRPVAGLLRDLKARGLLGETLVVWGGEFGRMPVSQSKLGRDHNPHGFTCWLAGGGVRGGVSVGATDDFGYRAVEDPVHVHDLHATILHLLGLDHRLLTYLHTGRHHRLTDVGGKIVTPILDRPPIA